MKAHPSYLLVCIPFAVACGVPKDRHMAVVRDLEAMKKNYQACQDKLSATEGERDACKDKLALASGDKDALAKELGATQAELEQLRKARELAEQRNKTYRDLVKRLKAMTDSGKLKVQIRKGRMLVQLDDKILFDTAKTEIKPEGKAALAELAVILRDIANRDFLVAGHTDNVRINTPRFRSNWELSSARAVEVVKFLQTNGVNPLRLGAAGFSEYDPVMDNSTDEGKKANRRTEIILMPNIEEMPAIDLEN